VTNRTVFNRITRALCRAWCDRARDLYRDAPDLERYPASHSSGPPHVGTGPVPAPRVLPAACPGCGDWCWCDLCWPLGP
jgi:hypothetical protein